MRSTPRFFNAQNLYQAESAVAIPGLRFVKNFFSENERTKLVFLLQDLRKTLLVNSKDKPFTVSKKHNLPSEEKYQNINFCSGRNGQFFPNYGETGHELTYFMGNKNIPEFVKEKVISRLNNVDEIKALQYQKQSALTPSATLSANTALDWNLTFNTYLPKIMRQAR